MPLQVSVAGVESSLRPLKRCGKKIGHSPLGLNDLKISNARVHNPFERCSNAIIMPFEYHLNPTLKDRFGFRKSVRGKKEEEPLGFSS